jgi:hypothetical protein
MSEQSITIKQVTAPPFRDGNAMLTPRLTLVVAYTKGGRSFLSGKEIPRGYDVGVKHDRQSDQGTTSIIIDGKGNPTASLESAAKFSAKSLERIANDVRNGKHDATVAALYAKAKANRPEYAWTESILPLVDDRGGMSEASLHNAISEVVGA